MYTYSELKQNPSVLEPFKVRDLISVSCCNCGSNISRTKRDIIRGLKKGNSGFYCCNDCKENSIHANVYRTFTCKQCGTDFTRYLRYTNSFCSRSCNAIYRNSHKIVGTRISKLEKFLQRCLTLEFPTIEIHYNRKDTINSELDIYVPCLKFAVELNGIFHYKPIYGQEKLLQTQNNDNRKSQSCIERGIELCIIDISKISYFKESTALPILKIIEGLINAKLGRRKLG